MTTLELRFLGGLTIHQDGRPLSTLKSRKGQALLCYLAMTGKAHGRAVLAGLFWPEMPQDNALMNLRHVLHHLNHHLTPHLVITHQTIAFNRDAAYWLDVNEFEAGRMNRSDIGRLQTAVALYQGDFLEGFDLDDAPQFEGWVLGQRARLREAAETTLHDLVTHFAGRGDHEKAITYARQLLTIEPWLEEAHRDLMRLLARSGQRSAALAQYETCRRILAEELGVEPAPATLELYRQIKENKVSGERPRPLSLPSPTDQEPHTPSPPHNLPPQMTPFVGREAELARLGQLLSQPDVHLLTILGPGGMGKTRLALALAERQLSLPSGASNTHTYQHGIYFASLARLETADLLLPAIAEAIDFRFAGGDEPREQLRRYLANKAMLLVLDNFEHLLAGTGLVEEILHAAPQIKIVITSRARLNRQVEQLFPVAGMAYPPVDVPTDGDSPLDLNQYSAVELFGQCARRVRPDFELSAATQHHVLEICRLLQGMPLGIVLAASWLESLSTGAISREIRQDVDFLATDMGDVPRRQRSLRAAFNHSWGLLSEREQVVYCQMSIFRGGFTRVAAQAVTGATLPELQGLVNKSLLTLKADGRYDVHELLRQFAAEKLVESPDEEVATRERHSAHYCALLRDHTDNWHNARQLETLAAVTREVDNARSALQWALAQGEWQRLAQAIDSWGWFHIWRGHYADGEFFCRAIVEQADRQTEPSPDCLRLMARALTWQAWFTTTGDEDILFLHHRSLALLEQLECAGQAIGPEKAFVLIPHGFQPAKDQQVARQNYEQALTLYRELGDEWGIAQSLESLGWLDFITSNYASGVENFRAALAIQQKQGDRREQAETTRLWGFLYTKMGQLDEAERLQREGLSLGEQIDDRSALHLHKATLAMTLILQGKLQEALQMAGESLAISIELGLRDDEGWMRRTLGEVLLHMGQYQKAREQAAYALTIYTEIRNGGQGRLNCLLGDLALVGLAFGEAQEAFTVSANNAREYNDNFRIGLSLAGLSYAAHGLGQRSQARQLLAEALASALALKAYPSAVYTLPGVTLFLAANGAVVRAMEIWTLAKCHPFVAHSQWFEDVAGKEVEAAAASLPPEVAEAARERGRSLDLWPTAEALLAELEGAFEV